MLTISDVMRMKEQKDINGLLRALQDQDIAVRAEAASSLGGIGDRRAVEPLISTLQGDSDPYVRSLTATALGELGDPRARDALLNCIASDTMDVVFAASKAQFNLEANIARGAGGKAKSELAAGQAEDQRQVKGAAGTGIVQDAPVAQSEERAKRTESKSGGCARKFLWWIVLVIGVLFIILGWSVRGAFAPPPDPWLVIFSVPVFSIGIGILLIFVSVRRLRSTGQSRQDKPLSSQAKKAAKPMKPQGSAPAKVVEKQGYSNKIGSVDIIWAANKEAVTKFISMAASSGITLNEAITAVIANSGSRDELVGPANAISLSPVRKAWCETTPIYLDKRGGGVYVLFEKLDDNISSEKELEYLGTINAQVYAAALCMAHGLDAKNPVV